MYIEISTDRYPITFAEIQAENPNVSFPKHPNDVALGPYGYANVVPIALPPYHEGTQNVTEETPQKTGDIYYQVWVVTDKPEAEILVANSAAANSAKADAIATMAKHDSAVEYGLPPIMTEEERQEYENNIQELQGQADNPSAEAAYEPPLPPGVVPPPYKSFTVTVTRVEGWQGALGFKVELGSADPAFVPSNLALAVYTNPDCMDYIYTTGAFVETGGVWGAVCPPGQEPGDVDINFGILYGSAPMSCWTMPQGQQVQVITAYEVD